MTDVLVLSYHAVSPTWSAALSVTPQALDDQLRKLTARGFSGATFSQAVLEPRPRRTVAITFDDAYRSVLRLAKPVLDRYGLVGTVFVPTGHAGRDEPMAWPGIDHWIGGPHEQELVPLSWAEIRDLAEAGWEIGSHTRSHPRLTRCDDDQLAEELIDSRRALEARLDRPCTTIAYPFGDHDDRVVAATAAAGYLAAATVPDRLVLSDPLRWPRVGIYHRDGPASFRAKTSPVLRRLRSSRAWEPVARAVRAGRRPLRRSGRP